MNEDKPAIEVNGRRYAWPDRPLVAVCIDGSEPAYIEQAIADGHMPYLAEALPVGCNRLADCVVPSFTNPNNISIVTGVPPAVHGIAGNYFYDREADVEVMMNEPAFLRTGTILAAFHRAGAKVVAVTAKDKLRRLLGHGMAFGDDGAISFSAEKADATSPAEHGIEAALDFVGQPLPSVYSAELSEFVFAAGVRLLAEVRPDIIYLSTTDYVQHKHAPGSAEANAFYAMMDGYLAKMDAAGATLALTADHGMNAKHGPDGAPKVIYLQEVLDAWFGQGQARVILPITDPYVAHHGSLGSFATAYLADGIDRARMMDRLSALEGIELALSGAEGCARFELPEDRMGDLIVTSVRDTVIGTSPGRHDLSALDAPLRSHGGVTEQRVPLIMNRPAAELPAEARLRNFDLFDMALNRAA